MTIFEAVMLGIVQGIAEFLPISSSGHLVVLQRIFGFDEGLLTFDIFVHIGSLAAILVVFWRDVWELIRKPFCKMNGLLIIGTIPMVIGAFFLGGAVRGGFFNNGIWLAVAFTVTGVVLFITDKFREPTKEERDITWKDALFVGFAQALALPPGISRSGMTIAGALSRGIKRDAAANFSFMLAIIAIAGVSFVEILEIATGRVTIDNIGAVPLFFGALASALVGYLSIHLLLKLIKACKLRYFSFYVWGLAGLILLDALVLRIFFEG
ncbi:MAG: undecaprenyl-diphosphate phosphatase [Defluviitaleaceae bacterium]|nr:undecaprenyl-diphosphate phosphatase [Defluviitaleaceae bacterium]